MIWVLIIVIVVLLAVVGLLVYRQRQLQKLREGFGPEYDRVVTDRGDQRAAEAELRQRRERRRSYDIKPLSAGAREQYAERWRATRTKFVDQPASALTDADALLNEVMRERGYPVEDFEQQASDVSVDHPEVVDHYRDAHAIHSGKSESTELEDRDAAVPVLRDQSDGVRRRLISKPGPSSATTTAPESVHVRHDLVECRPRWSICGGMP